MQNSLVVLTFSFLFGSTLFSLTLVQKKNEIDSLGWNLVCSLIQICRIQWWCELFLSLNRNTIFGQIWSKTSQIVSLSWNLVPNSNLQNTMRMFTLSVFDRKYPSFRNLFQKIEIVCWSLNLELRIISICRIQRWSLLFLFFRLEVAFLS